MQTLFITSVPVFCCRSSFTCMIRRCSSAADRQYRSIPRPCFSIILPLDGCLDPIDVQFSCSVCSPSQSFDDVKQYQSFFPLSATSSEAEPFAQGPMISPSTHENGPCGWRKTLVAPGRSQITSRPTCALVATQHLTRSPTCSCSNEYPSLLQSLGLPDHSNCASRVAALVLMLHKLRIHVQITGFLQPLPLGPAVEIFSYLIRLCHSSLAAVQVFLLLKAHFHVPIQTFLSTSTCLRLQDFPLLVWAFGTAPIHQLRGQGVFTT